MALIGLLLAASAWRWTAHRQPRVGRRGVLAIAVLLVIIAIGLGRQNAEHLIGKAVSPDMQEGIVEQIRDADGVDAVIGATMRLAPDQVLVAARIDLADGFSPDELEQAADDVERRRPRRVPRGAARVPRPDPRMRTGLVRPSRWSPDWFRSAAWPPIPLKDPRACGKVPDRSDRGGQCARAGRGTRGPSGRGLVVAYGMSSGPSYSDGPVPSVRRCRATAASTPPVRSSRPIRGCSSPHPSPPSSPGCSREDSGGSTRPRYVRRCAETEVLFVHDVDGRARFAALVERGDDEHVRDWRLSSWAMCEPSELTGDASDRLGYGVWIDADGDPVPTTEVMTFRGP